MQIAQSLGDRVPVIYSVAEAAKELGFRSNESVYKLIRSGRLEARRHGGRQVILESELIRFLNELPHSVEK